LETSFLGSNFSLKKAGKGKQRPLTLISEILKAMILKGLKNYAHHVDKYFGNNHLLQLGYSGAKLSLNELFLK